MISELVISSMKSLYPVFKHLFERNSVNPLFSFSDFLRLKSRLAVYCIGFRFFEDYTTELSSTTKMFSVLY